MAWFCFSVFFGGFALLKHLLGNIFLGFLSKSKNMIGQCFHRVDVNVPCRRHTLQVLTSHEVLFPSSFFFWTAATSKALQQRKNKNPRRGQG